MTVKIAMGPVRSWTALHVACIKGQHAMVCKLLQIGANPKIVDKKGETPLHVVCKHGHSSGIKILLNYDSSLKDIQINICMINDFKFKAYFAFVVSYFIETE